jgi:predicted butyrate kinase (DUF1464 family)
LFYNNTGSTYAYGGAISTGASDESSYTYITDCLFEMNRALFYDGGALYIVGIALIGNSVFIQNTAGGMLRLYL